MGVGFFSMLAAIGTLVLVACGLALLPALLVIGLVVLGLTVAFGVLGLVFRLLGGLLLVVVAIPLALGAAALAFALGVAILHAALPLLLIGGIVWLIARSHRHALPAR